MSRKTVLLCILVCVILAGCDQPASNKLLNISGKTMGTTYHVKAKAVGTKLDETILKTEVESVLADVNSKMSNWQKTSEISRFNLSRQTKPVKISGDLFSVISKANDVHLKTGGMFDVTLAPLINLWGFGSRKPEDRFPTNVEISSALEQVGQTRYLKLDTETGTVSKTRPDVEINLSAIAKGFGIDAVSGKLTQLGFENYLVEIGGDLRVAGTNVSGKPWRVGIEKPEAGSRNVKTVLKLANSGMATSGDYRNFVENNGTRYSHIIDPTTGFPITHRTTSVTVVSENAMDADAWATALLVMGNKEGMKAANDNDIAAYFISRNRDDADQKYIIESSKAFEELANMQ
jgi:thiamine biosynthesis lipoprotein